MDHHNDPPDRPEDAATGTCAECGQPAEPPISITILAPPRPRNITACPQHAATVALGPHLTAVLREATR